MSKSTKVQKEFFLCSCYFYSSKEVLNYFNKQHSTVTMATFDISMIFDKVKIIKYCLMNCWIGMFLYVSFMS